jgi:threonine dehydrogenase-like Zn-dependent dehydrogenase
VTGDTAIGCGACEYCLAGHYNLCPTRQTVGILRKDGAFAEQLVMPERHLYRLPDDIGLVEASLTEPTAVAVHAVRRLDPVVGQRCVVFGDGALGLLCLQVVRNAGATGLVMVGSHEHKLVLAQELGAQHTINYRQEGYLDQIRSWTGGDGPELIIEASGSPKAIQDAVHLGRPGARIVNISFCGVREIPVDMDIVVAKEISILGSIANPNAFPAALRLIAEGRVQVRPLISHHFDLEQAEQAFDQIEHKEIPYLRVVLGQGK